MFNISKEFEKNEDFRDKINAIGEAIGEAIVDLKETLKFKIQDQRSIYKYPF